MLTSRIGTALFLTAVIATQSGYNSCTGDVLGDSGFDLWCDDQLCSWDVEKGDARKVPTWHQGDHGVELVGSDVAISQLAVDVPVNCLRFELVADIDEQAVVTLEMDLYDDGVVDYQRQLPASGWAPIVYRVELPRFDGIRFRIRKSGGGRAVLAQIRAVGSADDCGGDVIPPVAAPLGGLCFDDDGLPVDEACTSEVCASAGGVAFGLGVCAECSEDGDCGGLVCGLESQVARPLLPYRACVAAASQAMGELCAIDGECATGVCCGGVCSTCCEGGPGCDDAACIRGEGASYCEGGAIGAPCQEDAHCASGACRGGEPLHLCEGDGRVCGDDLDCPTYLFDDNEDGAICEERGVAGGRCE